MVNLKLLAERGKEHAALLSSTHTIIIEFDTALDTLEGDEELLGIVIANLMSNAIKYSPENTSITFRLTALGDQCRIEVIDQGVGISEEELSAIFRKYVRGQSAGQVPGAGLGLSLVSHIVKLHGGAVEIESRPGVGTRMIVLIPFRLPH